MKQTKGPNQVFRPNIWKNSILIFKEAGFNVAECHLVTLLLITLYYTMDVWIARGLLEGLLRDPSIICEKKMK